MPTCRSRLAARVLTGLALSVLAATSILVPSPASAQAYDEHVVIQGNSLRIQNLIGTVTVVGHSGSDFQVEVHVRGRDATRDRVRIEQVSTPSQTLVVRFPLEETKHYVYPEMGGRSKSTFDWHPDGGKSEVSIMGLFGLGKNRQITVTGSGDGLELWADLVVRVPKGKELRVQEGCGTLTATDIEAKLSMEVNSGSVSADRVTGDLIADTGSGKVNLSAVKGKVVADTGSGSIHIENVEGDLNADTGSGSVTILHARGDRLVADTGSGSVHLNDITCDAVSVDTGSGSIEVSAASIGSGNFDTGSGGVEVALDRLTEGPIQVDTGSGSVVLVLPPSPSATVRAESSSGGVDVDLEGVEWIKNSRTEKSFRVGAGEAKIVLATGSGSIRIRS